MKNETFTPERIKAEADAFFEWDGEDRSLVTTTSCLLFALHIAGLMQARAAQPAPVVPEGWKVSVEEYGDRSGQATISGPGVFCMQVPVSYSMLDFMKALAAAPAQGQQVDRAPAKT